MKSPHLSVLNCLLRYGVLSFGGIPQHNHVRIYPHCTNVHFQKSSTKTVTRF